MRKSFLLVLLTALLVFGLVASASAADFSDIAESDAKADIVKLSALGVINGYPDGTFRPDGDITRAEFAKIAVIMAGLENSAAFLQNSASQFSDVPAGQWYTGWVNVAASQGLIKGYTDGTFKPDANISGAEAVTILVRLLGYDDRLPGMWPVNYLAKAGELGITDDVDFNASANATRGVVCQLASATLDQELVNYSKDIEDYVVKEKDGEPITLLAQKFDSALTKKVLVVEVVLADEEYQAKLYDPARDTNNEYELTFAEDVVVSGALNIFGLEGRFIDYITNDDDEIVSATVKNYKTVFGQVDSHPAGKIEVGDTKYSVEDYCFAYVDGMPIADLPTSSYGWDAIDEIPVDSYVTLFFNEDNKVAYITCSTTPGEVVKTVDADRGRVEFRDRATLRIDLDDDDYLVFRNGALVELEDLQKNDIVYVAENALNNRGFDYIIKAVYNPVSGDFTKFKSDKAYIGDENYKVAAKVRAEDKYGDAVSEIEDLLGDEVTAHLNANGLIRYITGTEADADKIVAVIISAEKDTSYGDDFYGIKVYTENGDTVTYDFADDYVDSDEFKGVETLVNFDTPNCGTLVEIGLNSDGEIDSIAEYNDGIDKGRADYLESGIDDPEEDYDRLKVDGVWKYYTDDTVIFDLQKAADAGKVDPELATWTDIEDADGFTATVYYDGSDMDYIVIDSEGGITKTSNDGVYAGWYRDADGTWIEMFVDGELVEYKALTASEKDGKVDGVIYSFTVSSDNKIDLGTVRNDVYCGYVPYDGINSTRQIITVGVKSSVVGDVYYMEEAGDAKTFMITDDTMVVDIDNDEVVDFLDIGEEDFVVVLEGDDNVADIVVIIPSDDVASVRPEIANDLDD